MIKINGKIVNESDVYDTLTELVCSTNTLDELYDLFVDIIADNQLEIMCIYETIVTEHAFHLMSNETDIEIDVIENTYNEIAIHKERTTENIMHDIELTYREIVKYERPNKRRKL